MNADSIIPGQSDWGGTVNPQNLNRYSYVNNNPVRYTDPTGHCIGPVIVICAAVAAEALFEAVVTVAVSAGIVGGAVVLSDHQVNAAQEQNDAEVPGKDGSNYEGPVGSDDTLVRRGQDPESATRLGKQAEAAEKAGFPHGVSVTTPDSNERLARDPEDAVTATRKELEDAGFPPIHTPTKNDPMHHTVVLPKPVTPDDASRFNDVFGRKRGPR